MQQSWIIWFQAAKKGSHKSGVLQLRFAVTSVRWAFDHKFIVSLSFPTTCRAKHFSFQSGACCDSDWRVSNNVRWCWSTAAAPQTGVIAPFNGPNKSAAGSCRGRDSSHPVWVKCIIKKRLPPKVCCRSCRWRRESWYLGLHQSADRSRGSWSPHLGPYCRRADGPGQSPA